MRWEEGSERLESEGKGKEDELKHHVCVVSTKNTFHTVIVVAWLVTIEVRERERRGEIEE